MTCAFDKNDVSLDRSIKSLCSVAPNIVAGTLCRLDDVTEDRSPPGPGAVRDHVG